MVDGDIDGWLDTRHKIAHLLYIPMAPKHEPTKEITCELYLSKVIKEKSNQTFMRSTLSIAFVLLILCISACDNPSPTVERPNILIINVDDMGWKDIGFMGSAYYETPNIDALSAQGMVFSNGYAGASNCAPSRASLLTGQWTPRHGIYTVNSSERGASKDRKLIPIRNTTTLAQTHTTFSKILHKNGYATCHSGKWHISDSPLDYGFELNIGGGHNGHPSSYYPPYQNVDLNTDGNGYLTDVIMEKTLKFVDTVTQPFLLYYAPYAVHTPIQPVADLLGKYQQKSGSKGQNNAEYATMVENLDRNIGLLISKLKEKGVFDRTLIIFTSDNGGLYGITQQQPLRAGKGSYYEGGIRVPFLFVMKDNIPAHSKSNVHITNLDLFPTLMHYAGIQEGQKELDGHDLSPILEGKTSSLDRELYWHFPIYLEAYNASDNENKDSLFRTRPGSVIRKGDWKLHYYFENDEIELFNLTTDSSERNNLASQEPEKKEELLKALKTWWKETKAPIPTTLNPEYENK